MKSKLVGLTARLSPSTKQFIRAAASETIGRLPLPRGRFTGKLAVNGGPRVRDTRFRPWGPRFFDRAISWFRTRSRLRGVFLSGIEGLPQPLAQEFVKKWTEYCGCRYGLLLPHGTDALRIGLAAALNHDG